MRHVPVDDAVASCPALCPPFLSASSDADHPSAGGKFVQVSVGASGLRTVGVRTVRPIRPLATPLQSLTLHLRTSEVCGGEPARTPDSVRRSWDRRGGHPSRPAVARRLQRPTRGCLRTGRPPPAWPCSRWGLPSHPGRPGCWCALTAPFHPYLCGAAPETAPAIGGLFSVALSCGSPRLGVTQHLALWSPDVPRAGAPKRPARGRPADSPPPAIVALSRSSSHRNRRLEPAAVMRETRRASRGRWR
jgi:hypothetical protein